MAITSQLVKFGLFSLLLIVIPGPSVLFVVGRGLALGTRAALAGVIGNTLGIAAQGLVVSAGVVVLVGAGGSLLRVLKIVGALYIFYLGIHIWLSRHEANSFAKAQERPGSARYLRDGFVVGMTNPKSAVVFAAVLSGFVKPALGHPTLQVALLVVEFCLLALASDSAWAVVAGRASSRFASDENVFGAIRGIGAVLICIVAAMLFFEAVRA